MKKNIKKYKIKISSTIRDAISKIDEMGIGFAVCIDEKDIVVGVVSDGDFRRAILTGIKLDDSVSEIVNRDFVFIPKLHTRAEIIKIFKRGIVQCIPVIENNFLIDIITEESFFLGKPLSLNKRNFNLPVVIMAGGKGARLDPFTRILPKPLVPLGNKAIIEVIMEEFNRYSVDNFIVSINHKARMIKAYFADHPSNFKIEFLSENIPLGTAGALHFLKGKVKGTFFVTNCDILVKEDYANMIEFHEKGDYALTLIAAIQHHIIPYGVCKIQNGGELASITEKPKHDLLVNTGMYILNSSTLELIPENEYFDMTDLIKTLKENNQKVGLYPVSQASWIDIGQIDEYAQAISKMNIQY